MLHNPQNETRRKLLRSLATFYAKRHLSMFNKSWSLYQANPDANSTDLDDTISASFEGILWTQDLGITTRFDLVFGYASAAYDRFTMAQRLEDLEDSVQFLQEIQFESYPDIAHDKISACRQLYASMLADLAYTLSQRQRAEDLEKSFVFWRQSVLATEPDTPDLAGRLFELGNLAFKLSGASEDWKPEYLTEACDAYERAAINTIDTAFIAHIYFELALTLHQRFLYTGTREDFDSSVNAGTKACDLVRQAPHLAQSDPHWSGVYRHCVKLIRFAQENFKRDKIVAGQLEPIVQLLQFIIPHAHQNRLLAMNRLGLAYTLLAHAQRRGDQPTAVLLSSFEKALESHEAALKETSPNDLLLHARQTFVGLAHYQLSDIPGIDGETRLKHLESSIDFLRQARLAGSSNLNGSVRLAKALEDRYKLSRQHSDLDECVAVLSEEGFRFGHSKIFLDAALHLVEICHENNLQETIILAYKRVFKALRRMTQLGLSSAERQGAIVYSVGHACNAAASALKNDQVTVAVELLEEGRNLFFSQLLPIQTDTREIRLQDPDLAVDLDEALEMIRWYHRATDSADHQANQVSYEGGIADDIDEVTRYYSSESQQLLHYSKKLEQYLESVRKLPGLSNFMGSNPFSHLKQAAQRCPIVYLSISQFRCDALIISGESEADFGVTVVPLSITSAKVLGISQIMRRIVVQQGRGVRQQGSEDNTCGTTQRGIKRQTPVQEVQSVLRQLWDMIVRPVLLTLGYLRSDRASSPNQLPHICWCPSGPSATFLPLHAAGDYARGPEHCTMTHVISTYTPTISTLLRSLERESHIDARDTRMLLISQPASPPNLPLPGVIVERDQILATFDEIKGPSNVTSLHDQAGRVGEVVKQLTSHEILHLACHGIQDMVDPLESSVVLCDGRLTIREIVKTPLPKAELVYLSACQTATGSINTPDESLSLAGSFLFAGYKGAVATMWSIDDKDGCDIATSFYEQVLKRDGSLVSNAAFALHCAVQKLLDTNPGIDPIRWIPFVYFGVPGTNRATADRATLS
ncbi:Inositol 1,4,5-trisphosphate receptor type 1 [Rhizoctonia solani]|uniref:Inositol 1,4,5-trisphosphate receptor type 1 n=1 Tax=Rhizoctonia solani TaxID=456999 RepID=A0A0K6G696_9AGAM|nr:Inositol 1,4,5-trisphosphate receptor type 1 [Rhizoctonia solani]